MPGQRQVAITGLGVVSPVGCNVQELLSCLKNTQSGIRLWQSPALEKGFPAGLVAHDFSGQFTKLELPYLDRCTQLAIVAARQAVDDAGLPSFAAYDERAGLYYGTVKAGSESEAQWVRQFYLDGKQTARPYTVMAVMHNAAAAQISIRSQILGPVMTHSSACTSSGTAIGEAARAIRDGYLDVAVAGGAEASFTADFMGCWDGTRALARPDADDVGRSCKPFARDRGGLVLGEGAAFIVLESAAHALRRGAACYALLEGYGVSADGHHIAAPLAEGQAKAMRAALADARVGAADIGYLNAHATATRGGDIAEAQAIRAALGAAADVVPVSSTKSVHGHLLGAASVIELIIAILALTESFLPATTNLDNVDPECQLKHVANRPVLNHPIGRALSFSSGLGGTNVALVVGQPRGMRARRVSRDVVNASLEG